MVDIAKFTADLIDAKANREASDLKVVEHAKEFLRPFFQIAIAAEEVFPDKIILGDIKPNGFACTTEIAVNGCWVTFVTQPESKNFTIRGMKDELAEIIPLEENNHPISNIVGQFSDSRTIDIEKIEEAKSAFAAFLKKQLNKIV